MWFSVYLYFCECYYTIKVDWATHRFSLSVSNSKFLTCEAKSDSLKSKSNAQNCFHFVHDHVLSIGAYSVSNSKFLTCEAGFLK